MAEKIFSVRQTQKTDTNDNWGKASGFIPKKGELIIYQEVEATASKIKIGNGKNEVAELEFVSGAEGTGGFQPGSDDLDMGGKRIHNLAPGENTNDAATYGQLCEQIGDIETALDNIIEIQNQLIGGEQ